MQQLGYAPESGSARGTLRRRARALGFDVSHLDDLTAVDSDPFEGALDIGNLRKAAALLVAAQCALLGHAISWPLEPRPYDLLVETDQGRILRVQVKSGTRFVGDSWLVWITKSSRGRRVAYSSEEIDFFGIVTGDHEVYMVPVRLVEGQAVLSLRKYERFRLTGKGR